MKLISRKLGAGLSLVAFLAAQLTAFAPVALADVGPRRWVLGGYLPSNPTQKVYVSIEGKKIKAVGTAAPASGTTLVDTNDLIFPGLVDMHSHVKYNILPLWDLALGQFTNRFEWRQKFAAYKDAVSFNMKPIKNDTVCAAVRWAEVKALTGGVTAIQGIGGDAKCAKDFGIHNLEIPGEFENRQKIRGMTDMIMPGLIGSVFEPMIAPHMRGSVTYDQAYERMLEEQGVKDWVESFAGHEHTLQNGVKLLIDLDLPASTANTDAALEAARARITAHLSAAPYSLNGNAIAKQLENMKIWLFGKAGAPGYLRAARTEAKAYEFLSKGGVLTVASSVRRYIGMFEDSVRKSALEYFAQPDKLAIVAHLSEGMRTDAYNKAEFQYAKKYGLVQDGLVIIHGVGLDAADFREAARRNVSIVWSPFSNLLLYGETLDVAAAKTAGVNLAIGADWTPTGSKTLLDELGLAKRYLKKKNIRGITDQNLVEMATVNAAKAIKRESVIGRVAENFQADLMLVKKVARRNAYTTLVTATQADVTLTVVQGEPLYGDKARIESVATAFGDSRRPETLPRGAASSTCRFQKAIRLPFHSDYDEALSGQSGAPDLLTVAGIQSELETKMGAYADAVRARGNPREVRNLATLEALYTCQDSKYASRFGEFIEKEIAENAANRATVRTEARLSSAWSPIGTSAEEEGDEHENE